MLPTADPARPLYGRDTDLRLLRQAVGLDADRAEPGSGMVVLSGDAGIGKTRLLVELGAIARTAGWDVLVGHCLGSERMDLPYLPFTEMLGRLASAEPARVDALLEAHPAARPFVPGRVRERAEPDGPVARGELFEAVHALLEHLGAERPVLLVVEDAHWADQSSRDLLTLLLTRGFAGPVSVVVSYRSDDLHRRHPLRATLAQWSRLAHVRRVDLEPLEDADVTRLVRSLNPGGLDASAVGRVVARAEGNAFFAEELATAGCLDLGAEDLSRVLLVRLEQLDDAAQRVVRVMSAAGRSVAHRLLVAVAPIADPTLTPDQVEQGLRDAVDHHLVVATESDRYAFRHALLAESVLDDLLPGERIRAHAAYAEALQADPTLGAWADVARHAQESGDRALTLTASLRAGEEAMGLGGPDEAFRHFERALMLAGPDEPQADTAALRAAEAATDSGRSLRAVALLQDRLATHRHCGPGGPACPPRGELLGALARIALLTESELDLDEILDEAFTAAPGPAPSPLRARLTLVRAQVRHHNGEPGADDLLDEAAALGEELGLPGVVAEARTIRARRAESGGGSGSSREQFERIIAEDTGDLPIVLRAHHHLGSLHHRAGRFQEAIAVYLAGKERAVAAGRPWAPFGLECQVLASVAAYESGDWALAASLTDGRVDAPEPARSLLAAARLVVAVGRGEPAAEDLLSGLRQAWSLDGLVAVIGSFGAIDLHGTTGDLTAAVATYDDAVSTLTRMWAHEPQASVRMGALLVGRVADHLPQRPSEEWPLWLEHADRAVALARRVADRMAEHDQHGPESVAWTARLEAEWSRLQWRAGADVDAATLTGQWRAAVEAFDAYGHPFEAARSRLALAQVLLAGGPEHTGPAAAVLADAADAARRLGADPLTDVVRGLGETGDVGADGPGPIRDSTGPRPEAAVHLTPREVEVIRLVADGRSNSQIGRQLFISTKTASVHVSNILAKLGAATRGEAAALARRRGLLDP